MSPYLLIGLLLLALLALYIVRSRQRQKALRAACMAAFESAYAREEVRPTFHMSYGYGLPIFKITHPSRAAHIQAETSGSNKAFCTEIQRVCGAIGSSANPYQATRAIHFAWAKVKNEVFFPRATPPGGNGEA